jgi:serine/threonine-protein kinase
MSTSEAEVPPSNGLVGGKYQLVKLIGRGGMGSVWEARHVSLGTPSAIKFIEAEYANSQEARSRFDKEAKAAATIQSKHAIQVYDHGVTDDGKPYIVMELLTGEPLDKRIERLGTLTLQDTARILQQVARGLARAHERGIVHRDLKPENIFIVRNTDDDDEVAKVLDFGIAKIQNSAHSPGITSSTKTGAVLGTPFYMSPEQARGLRNLDHRTDVWSLGVIAFKCVTGKLPFDGESVGDLLVKICTAPLPIPSQVVPSLPHAFDTWFMRALEREPDRRFSTVSELSEHLVFAAGLSARGATPTPGDGRASATIAASSGSPNVTPSGQRAPSYPHGPGAANASADLHTPPAAGMTAAPFTSSQSIAGLGTSRWKWVVGSAATGLAIAALGTGVAYKIKSDRSAASNSVGVTQAPAPSDKSGPPPTGVTSAPDHAAEHTTAANAEPVAAPAPATVSPLPTSTGAVAAASPVAAGAGSKSNAKALTGTKPTPRPTSVGVAPSPLPPPGQTAVVASPPTPPAPPPAAFAPKKPNKNDPGY